MTRDLLIRCRHRIANDAMAKGIFPQTGDKVEDGEYFDPLLADIDAELAEPMPALRWHEMRDALVKARNHLRKNRAFWNGPQFEAVWAINKTLGEDPAEDQTGHKPDATEGAHTTDMLAALSAAQVELSALHSLHGEGLEVHGWHLNGAPECLDTFIDDNDNDALGMIEAVLAKAKGGGA